MPYKKFGLSAVLFTVAAINGCVSPGRVEVNDVYKLQQHILETGPQKRSEQALGLMDPKSTLPKFQFTIDKNSKRPVIKLSLKDAIARALANNTDIAVVSYSPALSRQRVIEAAAAFDFDLTGGWSYGGNKFNGQKHSGSSTGNIAISKRTIYGTQLSLGAELKRNINPVFILNPTAGTYNSQVAFNITQPLLRGFGTDANLFDLRIARLSYKINESQFREQVLTTINQVTNAYYTLIQARREVQIAQRLLTRTQNIYDLVQKRSKAGLSGATKIELNQSLSAVKTRESALILRKKLLVDAQEALARILSDTQINVLKSPIIVPTTEMSDTKISIDVADQLKTALKLSPALEQARYAIEQSELTVKFAKNDLLPSLNVEAGYSPSGHAGSRNEQWNEQLRSSNYGYNVGLTFEYPIGNRARKARLEAARLGRLQSKVQIQQTADLLAQRIKERIRQIELAYQTLQLQRQAYKAAVDQLQGITDLYGLTDTGVMKPKAGAKSVTPALFSLFLQSQNDIAVAESGIIQAQVDYNSAIQDLQALTGELLRTNQVRLALPIAKPLPEEPVKP